MSNHISEEGPRQGHAAGDTSVEQQASQLASDIKYKARQKMKQSSGSSLSPAQVQGLYRQLLNSSPAPGAVKSIVKKKLFGEQVDRGIVPVSEHVKDSSSYVFTKVFLEGDEQKFVIRVTDKATGNTSYRKGDRAKIAQLRANPNISSVEITGRKKADDAYESEKGGKKAKKDYDGDGKVESGSKEHAGAVHNAIQRKKGGVADGQDTRKEEVIYEKEDPNNKKLDTMKGKNNIKINPSLGESIRAELDALKAVKIQEQEAAMKQQEDEKKKEALADQQAKKDKMMKLRILQNKMRAVRGGAEIAASHEMQGDTIAEGDKCEKCGGDHDSKVHDKEKEGEEDPRGNYTKMNLTKNKLRAMGLKMSHDMEGESIDEQVPYGTKADKAVASVRDQLVKYSDEKLKKIRSQNKKAAPIGVKEAAEDRLRDQRMERGGVDGNTRYDRPPARKATNAELGIKPGKTALQKQMEKKHGKGKSVLDMVKSEIRAKHGKGAIMDTKKK